MATMDSAAEKRFFHLIEKVEHFIKLQSVQAEQLAVEALDIAQQCQQAEWQAEALYQLASYASKVTSNFKLSNEYCEKSLRLANNGRNVLLHAKVLRLMGMNEHYLGVWENAQQHYHDAVQLLESQPAISGNLEEELGYLYYYISVLNKSSEIKDYPITCLRKAIDIFEKIGNKEGLARCYNMFANHLNEIKKHSDALQYHLKALELFEELNETFFAAVVQNNAGYSYCELGDFEKGFELLQQALETKLKFGNPSSIANSYIHLGMAHKLKKNLHQAIDFFHKAESILKELNSKSDLNTVYDFLSEVYAATGDFKKAYEYHILYDKTKDEMFNFDKAAAIMDAKSRFELEKKKKEAEMLRQKNIEIENYAHQLEISNNELKQFAHVASHDLKEPLRMISNYIHLLEKKVEPTTNDNIKIYMEYVKEGAKRMYSLINSLLEFSNLNNQIQPEKVDLNELLIEIRNQFTEQIKHVVVSIDNLPTLVADKLHLYRLFENLISNALKFNLSTKKILKVQYNDTDRTHEFRVVDNGIGIAKEYADKVFIIFQRLNARDQFPGTGIGLAICKKIVENLKGKIWVEDNEFGGCTFCISIPKETVQ